MLRLVILRVWSFSKSLFLYGPFCHSVLKRAPFYIVCNKFSLNFSSVYILIEADVQ